ncbi:helix-turn-helix domain-containing protein [Methanosarcina horonobensis]|uniref:hypothetical protein n=1 Tax=Methanosarcina horonobensis TaxID=418008 RepID=UPI0022B89B87|nr:hypothetical protein [Methanosarcina horonobensis]
MNSMEVHMLKKCVVKSSLEKPSHIFTDMNRSLLGKKIEPYGIGSGQFPFLMRLYREDGINQESLSDYLKIDKGTTARLYRNLLMRVMFSDRGMRRTGDHTGFFLPRKEKS